MTLLMSEACVHCEAKAGAVLQNYFKTKTPFTQDELWTAVQPRNFNNFAVTPPFGNVWTW